jgi:hypothetical protein
LNLVRLLGMGVCERSDRVPDAKLSHALMLAAVYRTGDDVLVRAKFVADAGTGAVTMQLAIRYARVHNYLSYPLFPALHHRKRLRSSIRCLDKM